MKLYFLIYFGFYFLISFKNINIKNLKYDFLVLGKACSYNKDISNSQVQIFQPDIETETIIYKIMNLVSLPTNFEIKSSNVDNAAATILESDNLLKRYILYNPKFLNRVKYKSGNEYSAWSILAHEIGHHLSGHTLGVNSSSHKQELEADEFSGYVMYKLGATLNQSKSAVNNFCDEQASISHPSKSLRLKAIEKGWINAKNNSPNVDKIHGGNVKNNLTYEGSNVVIILQNTQTGKTISVDTIGKNPMLRYYFDKKKWLIIYNELDEKLVKLELDYVRSTEEGSIMRDQFGKLYDVMNGVNSDGMLFCQILDFKGELNAYISFEKLIKK